MTSQNPGKHEEILKTAREVLTSDNKDLRSFLYKDIMVNALKCRQDDLDILDLKMISRSLAEFRHAACVFKPYRQVRKVSIFGSARVLPGNPYYEMAVRFGRQMVEQKFMVITGAAEGIMRAGIEGAGLENSFGVNILLPTIEKPAHIIEEDPKLIKFRYFFTRKVFFVMEADAIALFPGGFGTHDEGFEVLTLLQTGKTPLMPVVLMDLPGEQYWESWDHFIREQLLKRQMICPEDLSLYKIVHSPEEGADWIADYYSTYHSQRQVRDRLVIRLEKDLTEGNIRALNERFRDLIKNGSIGRTGALPEEEDQPELKDKPRITFAYNKRSAGRLNEMLLEINLMGKSL